MVASKGGISYEKACKMTRAEITEISMALALAHGGQVDWETLNVRPPKAVEESVRRAIL